MRDLGVFSATAASSASIWSCILDSFASVSALILAFSSFNACNSASLCATSAEYNDIAERNYGRTIEQMIKSGSTDLIFTYKEFISDRQKQPNRKPKLLSPTSFSKLFEEYLKQHNLLISPITKQKRVPYSLRHTYTTLALMHDNVNVHTLAKQLGSSVGMIEQHYSHLDAVKAKAQLRGDESRQLLDLALDEEDKKRYAYQLG